LRCLHVISGDRWAGAEVATLHLLVELIRGGRAEILAAVMNEGELARRLRLAGVRTVVLDERLGFARLANDFVREARRFEPTIVHSHRRKEHVLGALASIACNASHVRTQHGITEAPRGGWKTLTGRALDRLASALVACDWIVVSEELRRRVRTTSVHVVRNGLPETAPAARRDLLEAAFGDGAASLIVGFVGRLEQEKRPDRFLRVLAGLPARIGGRFVRGVVIGEGRLRERLERMAGELGLRSRLRLLGERTDADSLLGALDLLVIPSDREGHPMVLLEAMRAGVPVVASQVGGMAEVLEGSGLLASPEREEAMTDRVRELLSSDAERAATAERLEAEFADSYTIEITAERVLRIYAAAACQVGCEYSL
jgi:glycosyltransferase involved in cell wall biosynthesis